MKQPGDKMVNRWAQAGHPSVLFGGKRVALSKDKVYGTRLNRTTGKREIVVLLGVEPKR